MAELNLNKFVTFGIWQNFKAVVRSDSTDAWSKICLLEGAAGGGEGGGEGGGGGVCLSASLFVGDLEENSELGVPMTHI